jgi:cytochrome c-type biogenesis protein CcmF
MHTAHLSIAVFILGITQVSHFSMEKHLVMQVGERYTLNGTTFYFEDVTVIQQDNFVAQQGLFSVDEGDGNLTYLTPEKRFYQSSEQPMTEAAISSNLFRDLYVSLGEPQTEHSTGSWSVRLYYKSSVACIWLAGFMMALGGVLAASDKRYRKGLI